MINCTVPVSPFPWTSDEFPSFPAVFLMRLVNSCCRGDLPSWVLLFPVPPWVSTGAGDP